jgi:DNA gyrase inhibitor GyrI
MTHPEVRIERLDPMRVACFRAVGETPERDAWAKLRAWADPQGLLDDPRTHPVFGFNSPNPKPGRKEYGYECWICIEPDTKPENDVEMLDFPGGLYAVTSRKLCGDPPLPVTWRKLWDWVRASSHKWRRTHELEHVRNPQAPEADLVLDLYLPIDLE